jgi:hypothetical protein
LQGNNQNYKGIIERYILKNEVKIDISKIRRRVQYNKRYNKNKEVYFQKGSKDRYFNNAVDVST